MKLALVSQFTFVSEMKCNLFDTCHYDEICGKKAKDLHNWWFAIVFMI